MATEFLDKPATMDDVVREFSKIKSVVADAVDDGVRSALRAVRRGRNAVEDAYEDALDGTRDALDRTLAQTKKAVRQHPLEAMGIALAAVVVAGSLVAWLTLRRR